MGKEWVETCAQNDGAPGCVKNATGCKRSYAKCNEHHILSASSDGILRRAKIGQKGQPMSSDIIFKLDCSEMITAILVSSDEQWVLYAFYQCFPLTPWLSYSSDVAA